MSEYDCGPTSVLNAIIYLFERDEIPPAVIRNTMLYCLDCYSKEGIAAMMFLSNWLNECGNLGMLNASSEYLSGESVYIGTGSKINQALSHGGAAVLIYNEKTRIPMEDVIEYFI